MHNLWVRAGLTFIISAVGGLIMEAIGMPAGMLMGGALAVGLAVALGFNAVIPPSVRIALFMAVGLSMGASVAPNSLELIGQWPITLAALAIELVLVVALCAILMIKIYKFDASTSVLSSFPGHLSLIMALASTGVGNARQIMVIQTVRVMVLSLVVPIGAIFLPVSDLVVSDIIPPMSRITLGVGIVGCGITGFIFEKLRMPAGLILGSMLFATTAKLGGLLNGALPFWFVAFTFVGMGAVIGSRFVGLTRIELKQAGLIGIVTTVLTIGIVCVVSLITQMFVDMPFAQIWLALAPGGLESMGALGIALGYDTAFIAAHHVSRLLMLSLAIPGIVFILRRINTTEKPRLPAE